MLPQGFPERMLHLLGEAEFAEFLASYERPRSAGLRLNPRKPLPDGASLPFCEAQVPWEPNGYYVCEGSRPGLHPWHDAGAYYLQEPSAMAPAHLLDAQPGERVLDLCAAPGGKTILLAEQMHSTGRLYSCDAAENRVGLIRTAVQRMGLTNVEALCSDATKVNPALPQADRILADVPCSGLGIIRKKPDIRYKDLTQTEKLPRLQMEILCRQAQYVKPGGVLLYSTCTILRRENQQVVRAFLEQNPDFFPIPLELPGDMGEGDTAMVTLLPGKFETDGFFICKMGRRP